MVIFKYEGDMKYMSLVPIGEMLEDGAEYFVPYPYADNMRAEYEAVKLSKKTLLSESESLLTKINRLESQLAAESEKASNYLKALNSEERRFWMACCEAVAGSDNCVDKGNPPLWADRQLAEYRERFKVC